MKNKISKLTRRKNKAILDPDARVTNDTVALHREEILRGARKYIYPLQHSKHKLVIISVSIFVVAVIGFFSYVSFELYKAKTSSLFVYKVTKVIPFPVARVGSHFVSYESYLFEINHYIHYYETQQSVDFKSDAGKAQLEEFKKRALQKVVDDYYIKEVAKQKNITVSDSEINDTIKIMRNQYRLSSSDAELEAVLKDYWNWNIADFKRSLRLQILNQKVLSSLDTGTHDKANKAEAQLKNGKDFATLAKEVSEDSITKDNGGEYSFLIEKSNRDISPKIVDALFSLQPGQYSKIIDTGYGLEIVKNIENKNGKIRASHIAFNFKDLNEFLNNEKDHSKARMYLTL